MKNPNLSYFFIWKIKGTGNIILENKRENKRDGEYYSVKSDTIHLIYINSVPFIATIYPVLYVSVN